WPPDSPGGRPPPAVPAGPRASPPAAAPWLLLRSALRPAPRRIGRGQPAQEHFQQLLPPHRFGQVVVAPGGDALLAVTLHGMGGQGDHRNAAVALALE